jgi:hypothetical protein
MEKWDNEKCYIICICMENRRTKTKGEKIVVINTVKITTG